MGGGDQQLAVHVATLVGGEGADVRGLGQQPAGVGQHLRAGGGQAFQAAALEREQQDAQLVLQLLELFRQPRLGGCLLYTSRCV